MILITGASAGIGKALVEMLAKDDYQIYAASRSGSFSTENVAMENRAKIFPIGLDINNQASVDAAFEKILSQEKTLSAIVCNAGNGIAGAVEDMSLDEVRYQMETNFFGTVRCIQAALSVFRRQGFGKIVVTSSVAGVVPIPFQSVYSASKAALLSLVDALSLEVKKFGVQCCCVLPGDTRTAFTSSRVYAEKSNSPVSAYFTNFKKSISKMEKDEQNGMSPEKIAAQIACQLRRRRMKLHVVPSLQYKLICLLFSVLPVRLKMWILGLMYT